MSEILEQLDTKYQNIEDLKDDIKLLYLNESKSSIQKVLENAERFYMSKESIIDEKTHIIDEQTHRINKLEKKLSSLKKMNLVCILVPTVVLMYLLIRC